MNNKEEIKQNLREANDSINEFLNASGEQVANFAVIKTSSIHTEEICDAQKKIQKAFKMLNEENK